MCSKIKNTKDLSRLVFFIVLLTGYGCNAFFEEDIEDKSVELLAPSDGTTTEILTHTFWWEYVDGATNYRLQIVSPGFDAAEIILIDTLVGEDKFEMTLYPDVFQWRVRAENSAYVSKWKTATLTIVSSDDLTRQKVILTLPNDNYFTNDSIITCKWDVLQNANKYRFQLYKEGWGQTLIADSMDITGNKLNISLDEDEYWWGVQAINDISQTNFVSRRIVIDQTSPEQPILSSPAANAALTDSTVTFTWSSNDPVWGTVTDSLFVFEDKPLGGALLVYEGIHTNKSAVINLNHNKTYIWSVGSQDMAGNLGPLSDERTFTISE